MSSEALLENPGFFARNIDAATGKAASQDDLAEQYMELAEKHPPHRLKVVKAHVFKILFTGLQRHTALRDRLSTARDYGEMWAVVREMRRLREKDADPALHAPSWYYRWWPGRGGGGGFQSEGEEGGEGMAGGKRKGCMDLMACGDGAMGGLFGGAEDEEE